ncbi:MAG: ATP-binding cassette domain-containing protein [Candidatus Omnitrophica bacterium]|nr:ATP-binding cassette domain-containing protein [Candidatus Omnitrophota bacterium]MDD5351624.1 ATP-binding cassette domain-containing protein [Candidatus Omnitrophota bacterium]MDD5550834.1 ATP-binding cassette domain-containing protein [Candidatus Omnitrophota bacterium]
MITLNNLSKKYGARILFNNFSLTINSKEKIGLVGPNGAGKSTLFQIILGKTEPSTGAVQINRGIFIGYLPQESSFHSERTVLSELTEGYDVISNLKKEKEELESKNEAGSKRYGDVLHELESLDYFNLEHKAKKILSGLGFKERDFNRPIKELSGGWQMRTLLAKLLVFNYDLLLLDEPTNYLDLNAALWLKDYLAGFKGAFVMISHDKAFLDEVVNYTLILENSSVFKVEGNYEHYERIKEEKRTYLIKQFKEQEKKRKQLQDFIYRFHAQPNKAASVRAKRTAIEKMGNIIVPPDVRESIRDFHFPTARRSGYRVINLENISKSYGETQVYKDFDFEIIQGEKAVLAGENGAGKSTLLKILAGVIPIDSGNRVAGHNVDIGYFSQTRMDVLNPDNTVLNEAYAASSGTMSQEAMRTILGAFLFSGDDVDKKVSILSGGEKSRLILAKLLINPPNFLLLDEPTTHLDVDAVEALVRALKDYNGTLVCISHDIYFVRSVANVVFEVKDGNVRKFPGNFDYYLEKRKEKSYIPHKAIKVKPEAASQSDAKENLKEEEKRRKAHNAGIEEEIKKLQKERDKLNLEHYSKSRAVATPRSYRDNQMLEEYILRIQDIEKRIPEINEEIKQLRKQKHKIVA